MRENVLNYIISGGVESCFCSVSCVSFGEIVIKAVVQAHSHFAYNVRLYVAVW